MIKKIVILSVFFSFIAIFLMDHNFVEAVQDHTLHYGGNFENSGGLSCNCVAFRLDDIQDYWLEDTQIELINIFYERETPLTLGVLGKNFGNDEKLISEFNKMVLKNPSFEIANHGWEHEDFTELSESDQQLLLKNTNEKISSIFGESPHVFIPPFNNFNDDTIQSMKNNKMTHLSSSIVKGDNPPFLIRNSDFYRFPETATMGEYEIEQDKFVGVKSEIVFERIQKSIDDYGFAVVTMHPQEFSMFQDGVNVNKLNVEQIDELKKLLNKIKKSGIRFVTIDKINLDSEKSKIPQWIKNIARWWISDQIDDQTYVESLQYLINQGVIEIVEN